MEPMPRAINEPWRYRLRQGRQTGFHPGLTFEATGEYQAMISTEESLDDWKAAVNGEGEPPMTEREAALCEHWYRKWSRLVDQLRFADQQIEASSDQEIALSRKFEAATRALNAIVAELNTPIHCMQSELAGVLTAGFKRIGQILDEYTP